MTDFKGIRGWKVQTLSTDPSAGGIASATWSSGGTANQARAYVGSAGRTQNDGLVFGGQNPPARYTNTESYDGSTWTEVNDLNTSRSQGNYGTSGTSTSAIATAGQPAPSNVVESWDGTNWTEVAENNTARYASSNAVLSNTSGLIFGGEIPGSGYQAITEEWNGSAWTEVADLNTAGGTGAGVGITTAALLVGRQAPPNLAVTNVEEWNGSAWTETTDFNTARRNMGQAGLYTAALVFGGAPPTPVKANTEDWNGTAWTERADLSSGVAGNGGNGTQTSAVSSFGITPTYTAASEEFSESTAPRINVGQVYFNSTANAFKVTEQPVPGGTWASGTNLPSTRYATGASGIQTDMILTGGQISPAKQTLNTSYDGSTWTELTDMTTGRSHHAMSASGPSSATLAISGEIATGPGFTANTESWNGSAWTEVNDVNTARGSLTGVGIQTLALVAGGQTPPRVASVELWDGSSWTETTDMSNASNSRGGAGSQTAAIVFAGRLDPPASNNYTATAEVWNGTSWTEVNDLNTAREFIGSAGQAPTGTNEALGYGGDTPSRTGATEYYNGTSWSEQNDLSTARRIFNGGCGVGVAALASGGVTTVGVDNVEEWTVPEVNKTITVS